MKTLTFLTVLFLFAGKILGQNDPSTYDNRIFTVVEQMPTYPGGNEALLAFLGKELVYHDDALKDRIEGKVYVQFVVNKEGFVGDVKVLKALYPSLDEEAMRVVKLMPRWTPGFQNGRPVNVKFVLPFSFVPPKQVLQDSTAAPVTKDEKVFTLVEQTAEYPGGMAALFQYFEKNIRIPRGNGKGGKVYMEFIVNKDGSILDDSIKTVPIEKLIKVGISTKDITEEKPFVEEATRLIKNMPDWIPARHNKIPVKSKFVMPIILRRG